MNWAFIIAVTSLCVAAASFCVAAGTFYLSSLRPPKIGCYIGPALQAYHADAEAGHSTGFYLPVTFENRSGRTGVVLNAGLTIHKRDYPEQQFFMLWKEFSSLTSGDKWNTDEMAHAIAIPGRSTVAKVVWFMWHSDSSPKLRFTEGTYVIDLCYWTGNSKVPSHRRHEMFVSGENVAELAARWENGRSTSRVFWLDQQIHFNRSLSKHEAEVLLGKQVS